MPLTANIYNHVLTGGTRPAASRAKLAHGEVRYNPCTRNIIGPRSTDLVQNALEGWLRVWAFILQRKCCSFNICARFAWSYDDIMVLQPKKMNEYSHKITYFHAPILVWVEPHAKIDQWNGALGVWLGATQDLIHTGIRNQVCHQRVLAIVRNCDPNEHSCDEDDALHLGDVLSAWRETIIKSRFKANFVVIGCCATKDYFWRACTIYCLQFPRTLTKSEVE